MLTSEGLLLGAAGTVLLAVLLTMVMGNGPGDAFGLPQASA